MKTHTMNNKSAHHQHKSCPISSDTQLSKKYFISFCIPTAGHLLHGNRNKIISYIFYYCPS